MASKNIVEQIGSTVTVWCKDGNGMEFRTLHTLDEFGVVVSGYNYNPQTKENTEKCVFVPWCQVKYIDYSSR